MNRVPLASASARPGRNREVFNELASLSGTPRATSGVKLSSMLEFFVIEECTRALPKNFDS